MERALVDTSIFVEPFTPWKNNEPNYKQACLALLEDKLYSFNQKFVPVVSLSIMGELGLIVNEKHSIKKGLEDKRERMEKIIRNFFDKCEKVGLSRETVELCNWIISMDRRIGPLDALHVATAVSEKCKSFVFIDYGLKNNIILKKFTKERGLALVNFAIKDNTDIKKPKNLFRELE
jgi:predicted nucleic acid-binding protein